MLPRTSRAIGLRYVACQVDHRFLFVMFAMSSSCYPTANFHNHSSPNPHPIINHNTRRTRNRLNAPRSGAEPLDHRQAKQNGKRRSDEPFIRPEHKPDAGVYSRPHPVSKYQDADHRGEVYGGFARVGDPVLHRPSVPSLPLSFFPLDQGKRLEDGVVKTGQPSFGIGIGHGKEVKTPRISR